MKFLVEFPKELLVQFREEMSVEFPKVSWCNSEIKCCRILRGIPGGNPRGIADEIFEGIANGISRNF